MPIHEIKTPTPTKKWLEDQANSFRRSILMNQGALNHVEWMLTNQVYVEEVETKGEKAGDSNG